MMALKQLLPPRDICAITCYGTGYSYDNMGNLFLCPARSTSSALS